MAWNWNRHRDTYRYAVEGATPEALAAQAGASAPATEDTFLRHYYWPSRDLPRDRLVEVMETGSIILCLVAYRGQGKTSAIRWARSEVERRASDRGVLPRRIEILDYRNLLGERVNLDPNEIERLVRSYLMSRLFPDREGTIALLAWCLAGPPDATEYFTECLSAPFSDRAALLSLQFPSKSKQRQSYRNELIKSFGVDHTLSVEYGSVLTELTPAQITQAFMTTTSQEVALVYDNIDGLDVKDQVQVFRLAEATHTALGGKTPIIVAMRNEALHVARKTQGGDAFPYEVHAQERYHTKIFATEPSTEDSVQILTNRNKVVSVRNADANPDEHRQLTGLAAQITRCMGSVNCIGLVNGNVRKYLEVAYDFSHACGSYATTIGAASSEGHLETLWVMTS